MLPPVCIDRVNTRLAQGRANFVQPVKQGQNMIVLNPYQANLLWYLVFAVFYG